MAANNVCFCSARVLYMYLIPLVLLLQAIECIEDF